MSSTQSTTTTASKEDFQKFICEMYWIGENGGDTTEEVVAFIKKHKLLDLEEDDCVCGNNYKKGLVNNEMRCEDCDIDGKNYEEPGNCVCSFPKFYIDDGIQKCSRCGLDDHYKNGVVEDFCWEVNCDKCGKICDKKECPFDTGYDENEKFICDNCGEDIVSMEHTSAQRQVNIQIREVWYEKTTRKVSKVEEQIAQAMAYMKMVKESGKTCGLMNDLQHMGEDGTDWKEKFDGVMLAIEKEPYEPTWEDLVGYPKGIFGSFEEMINEEYGDDSDEVPYDYEKMFREAVLTFQSGRDSVYPSSF